MRVSEPSALGDGQDGQMEEEANVPVLFSISVQNRVGYRAFRLNKEYYSAYHLENEVLMLQGNRMQCMGVEEFEFKSKGAKVTIVYLLNIN